MVSPMEHHEVVQRIAVLSEPWWTPEQIEQHYGIRFPAQQLVGTFLAWGRYRPVPRDVVRPGLYHRHAFEHYLQTGRWVPRRRAAAGLGMTAASLDQVAAQVVDRGLDIHGLLAGGIDPQLIHELTLHQLQDLPSLDGLMPENHQERCAEFHAAVREDLGIEVEPLWCKTSTWSGEQPLAYAYDHDAITMEPIGTDWRQVWLATDKPAYLLADACGLHTYLEHEDVLQAKLFTGVPPVIPDAIQPALVQRRQQIGVEAGGTHQLR